MYCIEVHVPVEFVHIHMKTKKCFNLKVNGLYSVHVQTRYGGEKIDL